MTNDSTRVRTGGQLVVDMLEREGATHVFTVPGESFLPILDALYDSSIRTIATRHEGGASYMAEGFAKMSGQVGVCMATRGPGATNLSVGLHTARQDSTPVVAIIGQVHSRFRDRDAWQEVDFPRFFAPLAKWAVEISHVERIPELMARAFATARRGRPGPVVVSIPEDVLRDTVSVAPIPPLGTGSVPQPDEAALQRALEVLAGAKQPLILAGGGCRGPQAREALIQLAEALEVPVAVAFRRQDVFPNNHRLYAGHFGLGLHRRLRQAVEEADVLLAVGTRLGEVTTQDYQVPLPTTRLIHIDRADESVWSGTFLPEVGIVADAASTLKALVERIAGGAITLDAATREGRRRLADELHQVYLESSTPRRQPDGHPGKPIHPEAVYAYLAELLPEDAILTTDAGNFSGWFHRYSRFNQPFSCAAPTSGSMGYGLPAAMGAKLAFPGRLVVNTAGDGGFMMTANELETAVRENIPVINLVFNNRMYGTIRMHQERHYPHRTIATDLGGPAFHKLAEACGAHGELVEDLDAFPAAFQRAVESGLPAVIELITDPNIITPGQTIEQLRKR